MSRLRLIWPLLGLMPLLACQPSPVSDPWPDADQTTKPWTRWWWMGNAVDSSNLRRQLIAFAEAGLGGVEITPIYGVRGEEDRFLDFLSPEWVAHLRYTLRIADSLGLGVDMNTGTGWPFGGPQIQPPQAAGRFHLRQYDLKPGELFSQRLVPTDTAAGEQVRLSRLMLCGEAGCQDITDQVDAQRRVALSVPSGYTSAYALFSGQTRQRVKRAAPGGKGWVMDHFSRVALATYLARFDSALGPGPGPVRAFFNDSYEVYGTNWTDALLDTFRQRRGYALELQLPALAGQGDSLTIRRVRQDYFLTLGELVQDEFTRPWARWAHERQALVRNQAHGSPGNWLDLYGAVDIPECETFGASPFPGIPGLRREAAHVAPDIPNFFALKMSTSAAHTRGKPLASSESCTWLADHFRVSLSQMKPELDQLLLAGVNHVFFHGTTYSPADADWPGWLFYASTHVDLVNPSWQDLPGLTAYLNRCQSVLQAGKPATQLLLYWPYSDMLDQLSLDQPLISIHNLETWLLPTGFYTLARELDSLGYQVDYISDQQLADLQVKDRALTLNGQTFAGLVVPPLRDLPPTSLAQMLRLSDVPVIFPDGFAPQAPGLKGQQAQIDSLLEMQTLKTAALGRYGAALQAANILPEPARAQGLRFVKRDLPDGAFYFLVHPGGAPVTGWIPFREDIATAVLMNPLDGQYGQAPLRQRDLPEVYLSLQPGQSLILRAYREARAVGRQWSQPGPEVMDVPLKGPWSLHFQSGGPDLPGDTTLAIPDYWTNLPGATYGRFAGRAVYETRFSIEDPTAFPHWMLALEDLAESGAVWVNGQFAGHVW
ncbi:MAG: glycoside hydrolase, partial [Bacteroidetes bacterium]